MLFSPTLLGPLRFHFFRPPLCCFGFFPRMTGLGTELCQRSSAILFVLVGVFGHGLFELRAFTAGEGGVFVKAWGAGCD
jgi:hypothetical protein